RRGWGDGRAAQGPACATSSYRAPPLPFVLVAAHGGGIRAAYWTALALDCIVGVSTENVTKAQVAADDPDSRQATCESPRRTATRQQQAARRIFLASGVSGGAMGLYAYA